MDQFNFVIFSWIGSSGICFVSRLLRFRHEHECLHWTVEGTYTFYYMFETIFSDLVEVELRHAVKHSACHGNLPLFINHLII